jgi:sugar/nucleoside kinase (ribokinase family)
VSSNVLKFQLNTKPVVVGAGLVALDVVLDERSETPPRLWAGGTCGNVLSILAFLDWRSLPVARLGRDAASRLIIRDMRRWGVEVDHSSLAPTTPGPIIIHRIRQNSAGEPFHSFSLNCPDCGRHLPSYRPVPAASLETVLPIIPKPNVFFADRVSRGVITLAESLRDRGALIVFEPCGLSDQAQFNKMLALTHILKYSHDRLPDLDVSVEVPLVIETMGRGGLRYRSRLAGAKTKGWVRCEPYQLNRYVDTAGAGDWCTAGLVHMLGRHGSKAFNQIGTSRLQSAIDFGQALAAWNCGFLGARGGMYSVSKDEFQRTIQRILEQRSHSMPEADGPQGASGKIVARVCSECRDSKKSGSSRALIRLMHG